MPESKVNELMLDVLTKEHSITCSQIHQMVNYSDKMVSIAVGGIGIGFLYGIKEASPVAMITLPFIAFGLISYFCTVFYSIAVLGGYRKHLEEKLNSHLKEDVISWEKVTSKILHNSLPAIGIALVLGGSYVALCAVGWNSANAIVDETVTRLVKAGYLAGGAYLVAAALSLKTAHVRAYQAAKISSE